MTKKAVVEDWMDVLRTLANRARHGGAAQSFYGTWFLAVYDRWRRS